MADSTTAAAKVRSLRVKLFVWEYVWGEHRGKGNKCAELAGFCKKRPGDASKYAYQIRNKPNVKALIDAEVAKREALFKQDAVRVVERELEIATSHADGEIVKTSDVVAAGRVFLQYAGKLKDKVEIEAGATLEQLVLAADRMFRESAAKK